MLAQPGDFAHKDIIHKGGCNICDCQQCKFGIHCGPCYRVYREAKIIQYKSRGGRRHRVRRHAAAGGRKGRTWLYPQDKTGSSAGST